MDRLEHEFAVMFRRSRSMSREIASQVHPDVEPGAYLLLVHLADTGGVRLTDLASYVGVGKPTVSRQITFLTELGLVERLEAEPGGDRRSATLRLTEEGARRITAVRKARQRRFREMFESWDVADVEQFATLLHRFNDQQAPDG